MQRLIDQIVGPTIEALLRHGLEFKPDARVLMLYSTLARCASEGHYQPPIHLSEQWLRDWSCPLRAPTERGSASG